MRNSVRAIAAATLATPAALLLAWPVQADVKVSGTNVRQNGYGVLTFTVANESDSAATVGLKVFLPQDSPMFVVNTQPKPGWTPILIEKPLPSPQTDNDGTVHNNFIAEVDWRADNPQAAIPPKQFDQFRIYAGPLPMRNALVLPTEQANSDGRTVNWNDDPFAGPPRPGHPAPVLKLASGHTDVDIFATDETVQQNNTPLWPALAAGAIAVVALLLAIANFVMLRRKPRETPEAEAPAETPAETES